MVKLTMGEGLILASGMNAFNAAFSSDQSIISYERLSVSKPVRGGNACGRSCKLKSELQKLICPSITEAR